MAVIREGLRFVRGSGALIALRVAATTFPAFVVWTAAQSMLDAGPARSSYFAAIDGRMSADQLALWLLETPRAIGGAIVFSLLLSFVLQLFVWAAAIDRLERPDSRAGLFRDARIYAGTFFKIAIGAFLLAIVWAILARAGLKTVLLAGKKAGWSAYWLQLMIPAIAAGISLVVLHAIGAWSLATKVLVVQQRRFDVRKTARLALKALLEAPLRGLLFFIVVTIAATAIEGLALLIWRDKDPRGAQLLLFVTMWLGAAIVSAIAWHWTVHSAVHLYRPR